MVDGAGERAQPRLGLDSILARLPRVAWASQPWARWRNPFGIEAGEGAMAAKVEFRSGAAIGGAAIGGAAVRGLGSFLQKIK